MQYLILRCENKLHVESSRVLPSLILFFLLPKWNGFIYCDAVMLKNESITILIYLFIFIQFDY